MAVRDSGTMSNHPAPLMSQNEIVDFSNAASAIKQAIVRSRYQAAKLVNKELLSLYYAICFFVIFLRGATGKKTIKNFGQNSQEDGCENHPSQSEIFIWSRGPFLPKTLGRIHQKPLCLIGNCKYLLMRKSIIVCEGMERTWPKLQRVRNEEVFEQVLEQAENFKKWEA